jgi:hypothetical protein
MQTWLVHARYECSSDEDKYLVTLTDEQVALMSE